MKAFTRSSQLLAIYQPYHPGRPEVAQKILRLFLHLPLLFVLANAAQGQSKDMETNKPTGSGDTSLSETSFFARLFTFYHNDWKGSSQNGTPPARRIPEDPIDSPPFPNADWSYGGSPTIGAPDTNAYPLMNALNRAASRTKLYGWIEPGFNFSTSEHSLAPLSYNIYANRLVLDQAVICLERLPDTVQTSRVDFGFRLTALYGTDYRFTAAKGYFSQQSLKFNRQYGFDPALEYADIYIPQLASGLNIRVGRYSAPAGIESQFAPGNYNYTHSLLFTVDPSTQTGILATLKLNQRWLVQAGVHSGNDVAPWTPDARPSLTACISFTSKTQQDDFYGCVNGINNGRYAYNNVQQFDATWYHKFSKSLHIATEAWYMYERDVPNVAGNVANPAPLEPGANGAFCAPEQLRCFAPEWAAVNYIEKELSSRNFLSLRTDFLNDIKGQRTGLSSRYAEHELMFGHWIGSTVLVRPALRFERAYDGRIYDRGTKQNQLSFTMDAILKF